MGENLALNMESKGFSVSVYNRTAPGEKGVVDRFVAGRGNGKRFTGTHSIRELGRIGQASAPDHDDGAGRGSGRRTDRAIDAADGTGRRNYRRRQLRLSGYGPARERGRKPGTVFRRSGDLRRGEEGPCTARRSCREVRRKHGRWSKTYCRASPRKLDDGTPCCEWIGSGGAGHFVKTVHNGIEYGDMQLIAEAYALLKNSLCRLDPETMHRVFAEWNRGELNTF